MRTLIVAALCICSGVADAQSTRSQLGTVSQSVMSSKIDIVYRRPVARGRTLFGSLVKWGETWTPSADTAARITFSTPVEINGSKLGAGSYSMWAVPDSVSWIVIFSSSSDVFHRNYPGEGRDALRVRAAPTKGDYVETLLFAFPMVDADSARLEMRWGTTVVPLTIKAPR
jgi:hypothetical protein